VGYSQFDNAIIAFGMPAERQSAHKADFPRKYEMLGVHHWHLAALCWKYISFCGNYAAYFGGSAGAKNENKCKGIPSTSACHLHSASALPFYFVSRIEIHEWNVCVN